MQSTDVNLKSFDISPAKVFGHCLFKIRQAHGLSQKAVALDARMDQSYLAGLETGRRPPPRERQLQRLFNAIQVTESERRILKKAMVLYKLYQDFDELRSVSLMRPSENILMIGLYLNQIYQELFEENQCISRESAMS